MRALPSAIYLLCFLTSFAVMLLLLRAFARSRSRLLLWSALSFIALAISNLFLFADVVLLPDIDLLPARQISALAAVGLLLYGFIWEID
jgi:zinc transporter ZupT